MFSIFATEEQSIVIDPANTMSPTPCFSALAVSPYFCIEISNYDKLDVQRISLDSLVQIFVELFLVSYEHGSAGT